MRHAPHLSEHHISNRPRIAILLQGANIEAYRLFNDVVLAIWNEERPVRKMDDARHYHDAGEKGSMLYQVPGETNQGRDVLSRRQALCRVNLSRLRRQQDLAWLHAYIHAFDASKAQIAARPMQHDCAAGIYHVRLEEDLVDVAVV
jgi:hypothetical protein